jgi:outer membrane autotransporter protein
VVENNNPALDLGAGPGVGIDTEATGDFDAVHFGVAGNAGYDLDLGGARVTPLVRFEFLHAEIDGYTEDSDSVLNLEFDDQDASSFTTNIGIEAAYPISTGIGVFSPFARAEYVHEFLDDDDGVAIQYANDPTGASRFEVTTDGIDQDWGIVGAGVAATFARGWAAFADWNTVVGLSNFDIQTVNIGLRKAF